MKSEKKLKRRFYLQFGMWFLVGIVLGFALIFIEDFNLSISSIKPTIVSVAPYILLIYIIVMIAAICILVSKSKKLLEQENDDLYDVIDKKLSKSMVLINALLLGGFILFGLSFYNIKESSMSLIVTTLIVIVQVISLFFCAEEQNKIVKMVIKLNPEKKGNIYDSKFQQDWLKSCDELERQIIYEACFNLYSLMNKVISSLLIAIIVLGMVFDFGLLPLLIVGFLYSVLVFGYLYYTNKLEKNKTGK